MNTFPAVPVLAELYHIEDACKWLNRMTDGERERALKATGTTGPLSRRQGLLCGCDRDAGTVAAHPWRCSRYSINFNVTGHFAAVRYGDCRPSCTLITGF